MREKKEKGEKRKRKERAVWGVSVIIVRTEPPNGARLSASPH